MADLLYIPLAFIAVALAFLLLVLLIRPGRLLIPKGFFSDLFTSDQAALDKYINGRKTPWQVGRDYEMFIGYEYETQGWDVEYTGIEDQFNDMGRDLIATKEETVHIIQCKRWSQRRRINEKHIAQLYGTTAYYKISRKDDFSSGKKIVPVFITSSTLSPTAHDFAGALDVVVRERKEMAEFPRIKCSVHIDKSGEEYRTFYLPTDPQYDGIKLTKPMETCVYTVKEAKGLGFKRTSKRR